MRDGVAAVLKDEGMAGENVDLTELARRYERFAVTEARGSSALYEQLALAVAGSSNLLAFLAMLPWNRSQPQLFLAALRVVGGTPRDPVHMHEMVHRQGDRIRAIMLARTTQTNEPARCAVLLPILARLPQPLALLEVGASAGLCLLPDRYGYDYGRQRIEPTFAAIRSPVFPCHINDAVPLPPGLPSVKWRAGLDLNPLDVNSADAVAWLETLIWPGQERRVERLRAAIEIARAEPPQVHRGDLLADLPALASLAPAGAQLVVFHTAVLGYVASQSSRDQFADSVHRTGAVWISNEAPGIFPSIAALAPPSIHPAHFLLAVNGRPVAWTGPHGQSLHWFGTRNDF